MIFIDAGYLRERFMETMGKYDINFNRFVENLLFYIHFSGHLVRVYYYDGIVVDDEIVVVENVTHVIETRPDLSVPDATKLAMHQITAPVIAITMVLLSVFIPSIFMPGITGKLFTQFAAIVCSSMLFSAFNALSLSPALCVLLLSSEKDNKKTRKNYFLDYFTHVEVLFSKLSAYFSNRLKLSGSIIIIFAILAILLNHFVP
jgi:multidrug efflux pump subunit AcrB